MTPAEVRWRCERIQQLLARMSRREALAEVAAEALGKPWLDDHRPAHRLPAGPAYITDEPRGIPEMVSRQIQQPARPRAGLVEPT